MIDHGYGELHPLYEAMSVCSGTLQWLDQQEQERSDWELCVQLVKLGKALQEVIDSSRVGKTPGAIPEEMLLFLVLCLGTVTSMTRLINRRVRENLVERSARLRQQIDFLLNQVDDLTEKVDEVMEAWELSLDNDLVSKLRAAVKQLDSSKTDVPSWRETLELISD